VTKMHVFGAMDVMS